MCQTNEDSLGELAEEKELRAGLCNVVSGCVKESVVGTIPRLLGEKNFSVQEERSGGSAGEILELKGDEVWSCRPQTFCITKSASTV